jgi:hypothetical protein
MDRVFILSPARTNGKRAAVLMSERAQFDLATRLRGDAGVSLGEVFSFLSGLYFRGKYTYTNHFGRPPKAVAAGYVITSNAGLMDCRSFVTFADLKQFGDVAIDPAEPAYSGPLQESAARLQRKLPDKCEVVLLGSIATNKYAGILGEVFGPRLLFPREFVGRGDMSRGGLMLRAVRGDQELEYVSLHQAGSRRGPRPPKLVAEKRSGPR